MATLANNILRCIGDFQCPVTAEIATDAAPAVDSSNNTSGEEDELIGKHWRIHKFGGTCVADAERIGKAVDVVSTSPMVTLLRTVFRCSPTIFRNFVRLLCSRVTVLLNTDTFHILTY